MAEEKKKEETKKEEKKTQSSKFDKLIKQIEELSVVELSELVSELEEKFGVSASAPAAAAPAAGAEQGEESQEEKSSYNVVLSDPGSNKIAVIKAVREVNQDLGLKEAKDLVDNTPKPVAENLGSDDAKSAKEKLEEAGGKVELQ